jgi:hypothetical protein
MESILTTIKKLLGIEEDYTHFDTDITIHINSVFTILNQLAIGDEAGFKITDKTDTWVSVLGERNDLEAIKTYIYLKVRLIFDPPQTGYLVEALKNQCTELEWRLNVQAEGGDT